MRYPIGQQNFQGIREDGCVYIDKTDLAYKLVNEQKYVFLSRPRRFGKSLLLSTIQAYFEGRKELFEGLSIEKLEKEWKKYPVLHLELTRVMSLSHKSLIETLNQQFEIWENELGIISKNSELGPRFSTIIIESYKKYGQRVVVLVDEYDNPLINTLHNPELHSHNRELLKSIYTNLKALDEYIRFGMLTGVSRFTKMSVFSGLNNLTDISFYDRYATICGFTETEIKQKLWPGIIEMAETINEAPEEVLKKLKYTYDGYHFSKKSPDIYNPYSLMRALDAQETGLYWMETATPEFLFKKLKNTTIPFEEVFNDTVEETDLSSPETTFSSPVGLLYQTGYLTIKGYDQDTEMYKVGIPNNEVRKGFLPALLGSLTGKDRGKTNKEASFIKKSIEDGDIEEFMYQLDIFLGSVPYNVMPELSEKYFQNTLYLLFTIMGLDVEAEKPTSFGRSDIIVKTDNYIYIIELKIKGSAESALEQLDKKGYAKPYLNDSRSIVKIGIKFSEQTRSLESWIADIDGKKLSNIHSSRLE